MKRILILIPLFFSFVFSVNSQEITVATFNAEFLNKSRVHIKYGKRFDIKKESEEVQKFWNNDANRTARFKEASTNVAKMIKRINADILTLTEVGGKEDLKVLIDELKKIGITYNHWEVCDCRDKFTQQHVAVLSKFPIKNVVPEITGRSIYLEEADGDEEGETGISKGMKVTVTVDKKEIEVFVFHLKSERGGFDSDAKRIAQASIARRAIIKSLNEGKKVIVTGDLNSEKKSPSLYRIRGFDDIYQELIQTGNTRYFKNMDVRWTYNYKGEPEQIDHILISPDLAVRRGIETSILKTDDDKISDHNPVIVKIKLK